MATLERYWTVRDVMEVLPYGKTKIVAIINSLPHINDGKKLLVEPRQIHEWLLRNTRTAAQQTTPAPIRKKPRAQKIPGLTEDGLIPYRHSNRKGA